MSTVARRLKTEHGTIIKFDAAPEPSGPPRWAPDHPWIAEAADLAWRQPQHWTRSRKHVALPPPTRFRREKYATPNRMFAVPRGVVMDMRNWCRVLSRWSPAPDCGEKRLLIFVIASELVELSCLVELDEWTLRRQPFITCGGFAHYCEVVQLNPEFVYDQMVRARCTELRKGIDNTTS